MDAAAQGEAAPAAQGEAASAPAAAPGDAPGDAEPPVYEVTVKCIDGSTTRLEVPADLRGSDLKELISERLGVPADRQRLIFRGKVVRDEDLVGQHVTESGQTLHMVQRPGPHAGTEGSQSSTQPAAGAGADGQVQAGPHLHFQVAPGGIPLGMPQVDLSQIWNSLFNRGPSGVLATTVPQMPQDPPPQPPIGAWLGEPPPPASPPPPAGARPPVGPGQTPAEHAAVPTQPALGQPQPQQPQPQQPQQPQPQPPAVALQPLQIIIQQTLGNLAHGFPMLLAPAGGGGEAARQGPAEAPPRDQMPWRDLRRLHVHLARLLGRTNQHRTLPPASMPSGELYAFVSVLLNALWLLGTAVGDLQASLVDGAGPQPRFRLQLAMALVASARTFRGMASALQGGLPGVGPAATAGAAGGGAAAPPPGDGPPPATGASSDSEEEPVPELDPLPDDLAAAGAPAAGNAAAEGGGGGGGGDGAAASGGEEVFADGTRAEASLPSAAEAASIMQILPQILGSLTQPAGSGGARGSGSEVLDTLPPEVAAQWRQWSQPESFRRVVAEALQPPLSEAYLSGDATGSHHSPTPPAPEDFLAHRWGRSASRVEELPEPPEPPDHLSRSYLGAVLRDLGEHVRQNRTFASVPRASERYPHLAQLAALFPAAARGAKEGGRAEAAAREAHRGGDEEPGGQEDPGEAAAAAPPGGAAPPDLLG